MAGTFPITKFAMVMVFYAILACVLMPALFYYVLVKTVSSAGNGFIAGSVISVALWHFLGKNYVK